MTVVVVDTRGLGLTWPRIRGAGKWGAGLAIVLGLVAAGTRYSYYPLGPGSPGGAGTSETVAAKWARFAPRGNYIVVDRVNNRLYLRRGEKTLLEAPCSSGSGVTLREHDGKREWVFDTPTGVFDVRSRTKNPAWRKPDWAFVEEGQAVPGNPGDRIEYGSLGEYALHFGNGYLIHGTLYERLLGRSVTHGCIRLGRDDLRTVYEAAPLGTPIYIF